MTGESILWLIEVVGEAVEKEVMMVFLRAIKIIG